MVTQFLLLGPIVGKFVTTLNCLGQPGRVTKSGIQALDQHSMHMASAASQHQNPCCMVSAAAFMRHQHAHHGCSMAGQHAVRLNVQLMKFAELRGTLKLVLFPHESVAT